MDEELYDYVMRSGGYQLQFKPRTDFVLYIFEDKEGGTRVSDPPVVVTAAVSPEQTIFFFDDWRRRRHEQLYSTLEGIFGDKRSVIEAIAGYLGSNVK